MFSYSQIEERILKVLDVLFNDSNLTDTVIYRKFAGASFDPAQGKNVETYEDYEVVVIKGRVMLEAKKSTSVLNAIGFDVGEKIYYIKKDELPRDIYDKEILKDYIIDHNEEYIIKKALPVRNMFVVLQV